MASGRAVGVGAAVVSAGVLVAGPAWAHVDVVGEDVRRGASWLAGPTRSTGPVASSIATAATASATTTATPAATGSSVDPGGQWWRDGWVWAAGLAGTAMGVGLVRLSRSGWATRLGSSDDDADEDG